MQTRYRLATVSKDERLAEYNAVLNGIPHSWPAEKKIIISELIGYARSYADSDPVLVNVDKASHEKYLTSFFKQQSSNAIVLARYDAIQTILDARFLPASVFLNITIDAIKTKTELHSRLRNTALPKAEGYLKLNVDKSQNNLFLLGLFAVIVGLFAVRLNFTPSAGFVFAAIGATLMLLNQQLTHGELAVSLNRFNTLPRPASDEDQSQLRTGSLFDTASTFVGKVRKAVSHKVDEELKIER